LLPTRGVRASIAKTQAAGISTKSALETATAKTTPGQIQRSYGRQKPMQAEQHSVRR